MAQMAVSRKLNVACGQISRYNKLGKAAQCCVCLYFLRQVLLPSLCPLAPPPSCGSEYMCRRQAWAQARVVVVSADVYILVIC